MSYQSILARRYSRWLMIGCFAMAAVAASLGLAAQSTNLPLNLLITVRVACVLTALFCAAYAYAPKMVFPVLFKFHEKWVGNRNTLIDAAKRDDVNLFKQVFKDKKTAATANLMGETPLHAAADAGNDMGVEHLLALGADANARTLNESTPLSLALHRGNRRSIDLLKTHKASFSPGKDGGVSSLMLSAATETEDQLAQALANDQKGVDARSIQGFTALLFASVFGRSENVALLLKCGASINAVTPHGESGLHLAILSRDAYTVQLFVSRYPKVLQAVDADGQTSLMYAAALGDEKLVPLLLAAGADADVTDNHGRTALDHAQSRGHRGVVSLLNSHKTQSQQRANLQAAVQSSAVSINQSSASASASSSGGQASASSSSSASSAGKVDRSQFVDQMFQMLETDQLLGLDRIGSRLGKDIAEFMNSAQRSKVRLWWGTPESGKTSFAKRLTGNGQPPSPMLSLPPNSHLIYLTGQEILERKLDLKATLTSLSPKSILVIDDIDTAFDTEQGFVSSQDANLFIRSLLTAINQIPLYVILIGNFQKRRGGYAKPLEASHLTAALGSDFSEWIEHDPWEFKPLSEKDLLSKFIQVLKQSGYAMNDQALVATYAHVVKKNPSRPLREFEKLCDRIMLETEIEPDNKGIKQVTAEHVAGVIK